jgi:hypothetical protein
LHTRREVIVSTLRLRWRFFWSRRSRARTIAAMLFVIAALLLGGYSALPSDGQRQLTQALAQAAHAVGSLDASLFLASAVVVCVILSLVLIFARPYQRHGYLASSPSIIPPISVYVDAENQLSETTIRPFTQFLIKHLDGRRADLLYFMDASEAATRGKYKALYRFGFRPIDVPHNPTGQAKVKEAVDKELAMHAYERALLGPPGQEFIIVTGDQDFVALVYRLAALGHRVQVWATPIRAAYRELAKYLDVNLIDLQRYLMESESLAIEPRDRPQLAGNVNQPPKAQDSRKTGQTADPFSDTGQSDWLYAGTLAEGGEQQLSRAIAETLRARRAAEHQSGNAQAHANILRSKLGGELASRLASVGYAAPSRIDYWLDHLVALGVLRAQTGPFPTEGTTSPDDAARALFLVAEKASTAALAVAQRRGADRIPWNDIATEMASHAPETSPEVRSLMHLVAPGNPKRNTHARYFVRSAQALGLLEFDDVPDSPDLMSRPRIPAAAQPPAPPSEDDVSTSASAGTPLNKDDSSEASDKTSKE